MTIATLPPSARDIPLTRLPALDAMRVVAATAVLSTHAAFQTGTAARGPVGAVLARMDCGVAVFFVLSGFLLYRPWAVAAQFDARRPKASAYLLHRALRILPAYWLVVVVALTLMPANIAATPRQWVAQLLLVQIYAPGLLSEGLTQMWSLATEVAFYLILPLLALAITTVGRVVGQLRAVIAGSIVMLVVGIYWQILSHSAGRPSYWSFWLPGYLAWFGAGMLLAALVERLLAPGELPSWGSTLRSLAASPGTCWATAGALLLLAANPIAGPRAFEAAQTPGAAVVKNLLYLVIAVLVVLPAALPSERPGLFLRITSGGVAHRLGEVSYGMFLWHLILLSTAFQVLGLHEFAGGFLAVFALTWTWTVAVSFTSWSILERPFLRLKRRVPL